MSNDLQPHQRVESRLQCCSINAPRPAGILIEHSKELPQPETPLLGVFAERLFKVIKRRFAFQRGGCAGGWLSRELVEGDGGGHGSAAVRSG